MTPPVPLAISDLRGRRGTAGSRSWARAWRPAREGSVFFRVFQSAIKSSTPPLTGISR